MADIRNIRTRPGVRIYLHPADIVDMVTQPDVIESLNQDEMTKIIEALHLEINARENGVENANTQSRTKEGQA